MATIWWLRRDLRLDDNPALQWAAQQPGPVYAVYIHCPDEDADWVAGAASQWWLRESLGRLSAALDTLGAQLILLEATSSAQALCKLAQQTGAQAVSWNRLYEPHLSQRDDQAALALRKQGVAVQTHSGHLLLEPAQVLTKAEGPYKVFGAFWRRAQEQLASKLSGPLPGNVVWGPAQTSLGLEQLSFARPARWHQHLADHWQVGEAVAQQHWQSGIEDWAAGYAQQRDNPAQPGTSRMSPHLHYGEISVHRLWQDSQSFPEESRLRFRAQLGWRDFAHHLLWHFPQTPSANFNPRFDRFPWRQGHEIQADLVAWQTGQTGIDIVDAGMRELWCTGWMHNRVRMLVASLLTKNLGIHWQHGARWFWDTLVDADLANNTLGWQWVAGSGADAAPYFRIFNPNTQAERFDPHSRYRNRWLQGQPRPAQPIVDLAESRRGALAAYQEIRQLTPPKR